MRSNLVWIFSGALLALIQTPVLADGPVDDLTDEIVAKQKDILRQSVEFRLHQLQRPWQGRFWFLVNLANTTLTATGADINGFGRFSYLHKQRLRRAPRDLAEHATWLRVTANAASVGGSLVELSALATKDIRDFRQSTDIPSAHRLAVRQFTELDGLLSRRQALIEGLPAAQLELAMAETEVLRDVRNLEAQETARYLSAGCADKVINYLGYMLSFTGNTIAGVGGCVAAHATMINHGTATWRTRLAGTAGITDIIASSLNLSSSFDLKYAGRFVYKHVLKHMENDFGSAPNASLALLHQHIVDYQKLCSDKGRTDLTAKGGRAEIFSQQAAVFAEHEFLAHRDIRPAKLRFASQLVFAGSAGSSKLTNGIGSTVAAFKDTTNAHERFETIGGPAIVYGAGYCVATAELLRNQLWIELQDHKRRKAGTTTRQVLTREIDILSKELKSLPSP